MAELEDKFSSNGANAAGELISSIHVLDNGGESSTHQPPPKPITIANPHDQGGLNKPSTQSSPSLQTLAATHEPQETQVESLQQTLVTTTNGSDQRQAQTLGPTISQHITSESESTPTQGCTVTALQESQPLQHKR